jgi:hypothetical protein
MSKSSLHRPLIFTALLLGGVSCMAEPPGVTETPGTPSQDPSMGSITIHLVDGPAQRFKEVNIELAQVSILDAGQKDLLLSSPQKTIDLLKLQHGISEMLGQQNVPSGHYQALQLKLGDKHSVKQLDGQIFPLKVAPGYPSFLRVPMDLDVQAGEAKDLVIDFDASKSITPVQDRFGRQYFLHPWLSGIERGKAGKITGQLTTGAGNPLQGAQISAQKWNPAQGKPEIVRKVFTDDKGQYQLDLLPLGETYTLVSQPNVGGIPYQTKLSGPIKLTQAAQTGKFDANFNQAEVVGGLQVQVSPKAQAQQSDSCALMQQGQNDQMVIVSEEVATQGAQEAAQFDKMPAGDYSVQCIRSSATSSGAQTQTPSQVVKAAVKANQTSQAQVTF